MHLFDQVKSGVTMPPHLAGPIQLGARIALADRRFVLDDQVCSLAKSLVIDQADLLADCLDLVRLPAESFWLEWRDYDLDGQRSYDEPRVGLLVEADESGRTGEMTLVWERPGGPPEVTPTCLAFDLDHALAPDPKWFGMTHQDPSIDLLCRHFRARRTQPSPAGSKGWTDHLVAQASWLAGPLMFAFSVLLLRSGEIAQREFSRGKLNKARVSRGRTALLDYTEMRISRPEIARDMAHTSLTGHVGVRLHHVRGHLVRRGSAIFWRRAHMRGEAALALPDERRFTRVRM